MSKILLIDDEELIRKSVSLILIKQGYEVDSCSSGEEALERIEVNRYDLIISDMRMPGLNGVETIKRIRDILKEKQTAAIPEIIITGYAEEELAREIEELGVADYIYKPFDLNQLLSSVKRHIVS